MAQKHCVDESAAKKLCKLSTLLHAAELCVCIRAPRWCRAVCAAQPQSGRIFKVLSLPKLQFSLLCLNFTAIFFLQYSDTYISGDVLYRSCKTACNSPGSSVVFYASASVKELQSFQVFPMRTEQHFSSGNTVIKQREYNTPIMKIPWMAFIIYQKEKVFL